MSGVQGTSLFDLSGKKAFVTGAAAGIGRTCALALAHAGVDVAIVDFNEELGHQTAAEVRRAGRKSLFLKCDVTRGEQVRAAIKAVVREFGRLDIAINNAGIFRAGIDESYLEEDWNRVIDVNLTGTWMCARAEMQQMIKQTPVEGKIINIASIGAHIACSNGAYDASKAAVVHLTRTLAARWGRYNINVNSVSPGYVGTVFGGRRSAEECEQLRSYTPLGHVERLKDLEGPILFFASSASDYVTGQDLIVDGGHTLSTWMVPLNREVPPRVGPQDEIDE